MDDGYTSWRGGVTNNKNGTYTINYRIDSQKALLNALSPLEIYVKIDDGTMFNNETMNRYDDWGEELQEEFKKELTHLYVFARKYVFVQ